MHQKVSADFGRTLYAGLSDLTSHTANILRALIVRLRMAYIKNETLWHPSKLFDLAEQLLKERDAALEKVKCPHGIEAVEIFPCNHCSLDGVGIEKAQKILNQENVKPA